MKITLIIGLPASGKSRYAIELARKAQYEYPYIVIVDDPRSLDEIPKNLRDTDYLIITDPYFCKDNVLLSAIMFLQHLYPLVGIELIFFKNDPKQCQINALQRPGKNVKEFINILSKVYNPYPNSEVIEVYHVIP